ncbi:MAG: hypothetical protein J0M19_08225 [Sphingomonadales bacterium]|nr:hypothetical protein [Sphingomonadales bacterium]
MPNALTKRRSGWPLAGLLVVFGLQTTLVTGRAINWDEFFHYSQIHNLAAGTLSLPLQTLYTRAFRWVIDLPGSTIDHIVVIRWFMLACEVVTVAAIIGIARRFASPAAAWLAALTWLSAGYVFQHGTSFRFDPPAAALLMSAAWIMLCRPLRISWIIANGLLLGIATVLTIKSVLYAPVFAGIAWLRWQEGNRTAPAAIRLAVIAVAAMASAALVYWLHARGLTGETGGAAKTTISGTGGKMFGLLDQPYWRHHLKGIAIAPAVALLSLGFPFMLLRHARPAAEKAALLGLVLPLSTLLYYHNTAPYFYVFMLAPVCAGLAIVIEPVIARYGQRTLAIVLAALAVVVWMMEKPGVQTTQRQLIAIAEAALPGRPAYIDACAMLGRFPKANLFMTPVGMALYQQGAFPSMASVMAERPVPVVLANDPILDRALNGSGPVPELLPNDLKALRGNYVHFWGPLWVAGKSVPQTGTFTIAVPGSYRVEGGTLTIDGVTVAAEQTVELARGEHRVELAQAAPVRLVWSSAIMPKAPPPPAPYFVDF